METSESSKLHKIFIAEYILKWVKLEGQWRLLLLDNKIEKKKKKKLGEGIARIGRKEVYFVEKIKK